MCLCVGIREGEREGMTALSGWVDWSQITRPLCAVLIDNLLK